jgi:sarcosine oxidase
MSREHFDAIVVGVGGMGSATVFELARRGMHVVGLEQFQLGHDQGSSHGRTRVIRKAYYEHPGYVPLLERAYEQWYDLEQRTGARLFVECGCLNIGDPSSELIRGVQATCTEHAMPVEELSAGEINRRFPALRFSDPYVGLLEHCAGFLLVEDCVRAHIAAATSLNAVVNDNEPVLGWRESGGVYEVRTERKTYVAKRLVLTAGPWATKLLADLGAPLTVMRQTPLWFGVSDPAQFRRDRLPVYMADTPDGYYYGFPVIDSLGHKVARHYGANELADPTQIERGLDERDETDVRAFLQKHVPAATGTRTYGSVCTYTLTPDRHFILDRNPKYPGVAFAAGFSGHGYKFAPIVGSIMADLVERGTTGNDIDMFRVNRFRLNV